MDPRRPSRFLPYTPAPRIFGQPPETEPATPRKENPPTSSGISEIPEKYQPLATFGAALLIRCGVCAVFGLFIALTSNPIWMLVWMVASVSIWAAMRDAFPNPFAFREDQYGGTRF